MLDQLVLPAGATRVSTAPRTDGNFLDGPFMRYLIAPQVDRSRIWTLRGTPKAAVTDIEAHLPTTARAIGATSGSSVIQDTYSLPTVSPRTRGRGSWSSPR